MTKRGRGGRKFPQVHEKTERFKPLSGSASLNPLELNDEMNNSDCGDSYRLYCCHYYYCYDIVVSPVV